MSDAEIEVLVTRLEKSLHSEIFITPRIWWVISAASIALVAVPDIAPASGGLASVAAFIAWSFSQNSREVWRDIEKERALALWRAWMKRQTLLDRHRGDSKTRSMCAQISKIYAEDQNGEILPLKQAIRLVSTYDSQQQRLEIVINHLEGLRGLRNELNEKLAQLRNYGEENQKVQVVLRKIEEDLRPLEAVLGRIQASSLRLEMLLKTVQKEMQIKQLHSEIHNLTSDIELGESNLLDVTERGDGLFEIERQITREVETFLQLERETNRHMREI